MPIAAPVIAGGIQAAGSLIGSALSNASTARQNKLSRKFSEHMYARQRGDNLADWAMQNEYNSPANQMKLFKDAGLNPNLLYGDGGGFTAASPVRSSDAPTPTFNSSRWDIGGAVQNGLTAYFDTQIKQAQVDNLTTQNTVLTQDALLKAAQTIATTAQAEKTSQDTSTGKFNLMLAQELKETSVAAARANLDKTLADTRFTLNEDERKAAMNTSSIAEAAQRILSMRKQNAKTDVEIQHINQQIKNLQSDNQLKQLDIELRKMGISPTDSMGARILGRLLSGNDAARPKEFQDKANPFAGSNPINDILNMFK